MNIRAQNFLRAAVIGGLAVGPILHYAFTVVEFGCGFVSSFAITTYAGEDLLQGAITGLISALLHAWLPNRRWLIGLVTGGIVFLRWTTFYALEDLNGRLPHDRLASYFVFILCFTLAGLFTGYFTARITQRWTILHDEKRAIEKRGAPVHPDRYQL